jgi:Ni,Fe-hydrogenase I small subunit
MNATTATIISATGYCNAWGSAKNARRVHGLTGEERAAIKAESAEILIDGAPAVRGVTIRRVVCISGRFYARMPK